ncbi:hypothetical protein EOE18_10150 [Novosphingobium umbonatum]|uniref:Uncharacterized protein n=1 Tax=Novosphingobium umbonatum TaxID=1908524 RepID=A0A437N5E8_9SPHN|nr:hypothetical protein [Novosphingobium umbonatum]RVU05081.1 hypothetical protein EOE18_10150 [Novosphingobium umbonatum]
MPTYTSVSIGYQAYVGPTPRSTGTFVYQNKITAIRPPLEKNGKIVEGRQAHFVAQLRALQSVVGNQIPVHIQWASGERNQMDKGCIGHAFGPGLPIERIVSDEVHGITHVILRD